MRCGPAPPGPRPLAGQFTAGAGWHMGFAYEFVWFFCVDRTLFLGYIYIYTNDIGLNMRQKLITLDPTSYEIASKMENFSQWVRRKLRQTRDPLQMELDYAEQTIGELQERLENVKEGRVKWVSPHGWLKVGEEE